MKKLGIALEIMEVALVTTDYSSLKTLAIVNLTKLWAVVVTILKVKVLTKREMNEGVIDDMYRIDFRTLVAEFGSRPESPFLATLGQLVEVISHLLWVIYNGCTIFVSSNEVLQATNYILGTTLGIERTIIALLEIFWMTLLASFKHSCGGPSLKIFLPTIDTCWEDLRDLIHLMLNIRRVCH